MNLLSLGLVGVISTAVQLAFLEQPQSIPEMNFNKCSCLRGFWPAVRMRVMKRARVLLLTTLAILTIGGWFWWGKTIKGDMGIYSPATLLLYLESNRPFEMGENLVFPDARKGV